MRCVFTIIIIIIIIIVLVLIFGAVYIIADTTYITFGIFLLFAVQMNVCMVDFTLCAYKWCI